MYFPQYWPFGWETGCTRLHHILLKLPGPFPVHSYPPGYLLHRLCASFLIALDFGVVQDSQGVWSQFTFSYRDLRLLKVTFFLPCHIIHASLSQGAAGQSIGSVLYSLSQVKLQGFSALSGHCPFSFFLYGKLQSVLIFPFGSVSSVNCLPTHLHLRASGDSLEVAGVCFEYERSSTAHMSVQSPAGSSAWGGSCEIGPSWRKRVIVGRMSLEVISHALFSDSSSSFAKMPVYTLHGMKGTNSSNCGFI